MKRVVVIVGANRGIGLEIAKRFQTHGDNVYALCRNANASMRETLSSSRILEGIDVGKDDVEKRLQSSFKDVDIDILIHNAGILKRDSLDTFDSDDVCKQFEINALGPLRVCRALKDRVRSKTGYIGLMTSQMGSMDDNTSGGYYGYRMSKAALNMAGKSLSEDLRDSDIHVQLLHPGFVKTDMYVKRAGRATRTFSGQTLFAPRSTMTNILT